MISPTKQLSNETVIINTIRSCNDYIYWVDKYFNRIGLEWLVQAWVDQKVNTVKIITTKLKPEKAAFLRDYFKKFKTEMKEKNASCKLHILADSKFCTAYTIGGS